MDKLAKALNKARTQRSQALGGIGVIQNAGRAKDYHRQEAPLIQAYNTVKIDETHLDRNRIVAHRIRSKEADMFRILRTQVLQAMAQNGMKALGVTSPNYGDGKTTIALNLALSIALDLKQTVLLVDMDLRKPNVMDYLGLIAPVGLTDYFTNNIPIAECLMRTSFERLSMLPAGRMLENSSEVLGSPKIAALADELKTRYPDRIVIYDLPPILAQDDPLVFLPHIDSVLMVIEEGNTSTQDLKSALRAISGAHVIGTVLNNSNASSGSEWLNRLLNRSARTA
jgi:capsular exopolysaccharide synthesis family protein